MIAPFFPTMVHAEFNPNNIPFIYAFSSKQLLFLFFPRFLQLQDISILPLTPTPS